MKKPEIKKMGGVTYELDPLSVIQARLDAITSRLHNIDRYTARIESEGIELSVKEYITRLRKQKSDLIKKKEELTKERFTLPQYNPGNLSSITRFNSPATNEEIYGIDIERTPLKALSLKESLINRPITQPEMVSLEQRLNGMLPPLSWNYGITGYDISGDSYAHIGGQTDHVLDIGTAILGMTLYDDADWYRFDSPDSVLFIFKMNWEFPPASTDMWILTSITARQRVEYTNNADDFGRCQTCIGIVNSDAEGDFPPRIYLGNTSVFQEISNAQYESQFKIIDVFDRHSSNTQFESDIYRFDRYFPIKQGRTAKIELAHFIKLQAQDGTVDVLSVLRNNNIYESGTNYFGEPLLWYYAFPASADSVPSSGCFITTAICETLGKPDDCYELNLLRNYRDNYMKSLTNGQELIIEYYQKAPGLLAYIDSNPHREQILKEMYREYLVPIIKSIEESNNSQALFLYTEMITYLESLIITPKIVATV